MSGYMKRLNAPRTWPLERKVATWVTKQSPGPHSLENSIPAALLIRDVLSLCDTAREAEGIIGRREILVDGRKVKSAKMPIGIMDVVSIPKVDTHYRVLFNDNGKIVLTPIDAEAAKWKLVRIENKTTQRGGRIQINLHDGRNIVVDNDRYHTGDVLKIAVPSQEVLEHYPLKKGAVAMVIGGSLTGEVMDVDDYVVTRRPTPNVVRFTNGTETIKDNVFIIGVGKPVIKLPEVMA
ncbi:MAG: small subunit ribosomal protein S4e [Candidatus Methanomethylophilaceae archaeon]|nr:small subunit ribosomal protein S4e [Candidatus Methanomethylophilaceae archaeon]